jgi:hypothetical protein
LQSDKNERCQQGTSADDLGQSRELLECHRSNNSRAPHTLDSRNPRADASLSEGLTTCCSQPNFVRKYHTLGTTPAVAAGLEEKPWSLEQVVEMTSEYQSQNPVSNVHH